MKKSYRRNKIPSKKRDSTSKKQNSAEKHNSTKPISAEENKCRRNGILPMKYDSIQAREQSVLNRSSLIELETR